jgi:hypothetical protein
MNSQDRRRAAVVVLVGVLVPFLIVYAGLRLVPDEPPAATRTDVVVGKPGGEVVTPSPMATEPVESAAPSAPATPDMTPAPTRRATPGPTVQPTPQPTAAPAVAAPQPTRTAGAGTPSSGTAPSSSAPTPAPVTAVTAAVADDAADTVAAFYRRVSDGDFDAAYGLWSDRMKAAYPRQTNLDSRFAETASVTFTELRVVSQSQEAATVQTNFVERYEGGGSRQFIGYWRLVLVDDAWLLDEPTY